MVRLTLNRFITSGLVTAGVALATSAHAAFNCASSNPADWPPSSKPYFMLAVDTSGSMVSCTNPTSGSASCKSGYVDNSCGLEPTRLNDAKCAMTKTIQAFAGEVNFGLMTYATKLQGCSAGAVPDSCTNANGSCPGGANQPIEDGEHYAANGCTVSTFTNPDNNPSNTCGNTPDCGASTTNLAQIYTGATVAGVTLPGANWPNGGNILVDMLKDPTWSPTSTPPSNTAQLLAYFDGRTDNSQEIYASGYTPLEGILRTAHQYYAAGWSSAWANNNYCATGGATIDHPSPIDPVNDRPCRSLNVILVTDGDEDCNGTPANAATALDTVGVVIQGVRVPIKTYVIGFAGATTSSLDAIAKAGGTTASYSASNEVTLSEALASIISGSVSPEVCDNTDNNCNGCVDEGFKKYCDRNRTAETLAFLQTAANNPDSTMCCTWTSDAAGGDRSKCLAAFSGSISAANPQGSKYFLPCWDPTTNDATPSADWLCTNPGEACDNKDNNCDVDIDPTQADFATNTVDELEQKCGSPLHCPTKETCNGQDDDCDGVIDNAPGSGVPYSICPNSCQATTELCNGCDDDCDGIADNGVGAIACGFSPPAACLGTETCKTAGMAVPVGGCVAGVTKPGVNEYSACSAKGTAEVCDGIDNDCDGVVDDNVTDAGGACTPNPGDPTTGACHAGTKVCQNGKLVCVGYVGPTTEICDGIDNDCNGKVDDGVAGVGLVCGSATGTCTKGTTACVGGTIVCQGGKAPQPEVCDGLDNDCNGVTDDGLTDTPKDLGCWSNPVSSTCTTSCTTAGDTWCPPPGATCDGLGTLVGTCKAGTLTCDGPKGWQCQGSQVPVPEQCNGLDDDCNGTADDNLGAPIGGVCGKTVANTPCRAGVLVCVDGAQVCQGQVAPQPEVCNGIDDNCNGQVDEGLNVGGSCEATYDHSAYPGPDRQGPACPPGVLQCTAGGQQTCVGGIGPQPEVCDGIDNDCDGLIDETGPAPDGIDGSVDPTNPAQHIGDPCGASQGQCLAGKLGCQAGRVVCLGATGSQPETCDCLDNNCNGKVDEDPGPTDPPLCSSGKTCVQNGAGSICQCASPCSNGEFPCAGGQQCVQGVLRSGTTQVESVGYCLPINDPCGDCTTKTVKNTDGSVACAPKGSQSSSGRPVPVCECKGQSGCHEPCFGAAPCPTGQACAPLLGTCQPQNDCFFFGCPPGQACSANNACVTDPCNPNPCTATQECRPTPNLTSFSCVASCAGIDCAVGQTCVNGTCQATGCPSGCPAGQYCLAGAGDAGASCGPSRCSATSCAQGGYCDPQTGSCGADPCAAVVCPTSQVCQAGQCVLPQTTTTPDAGSRRDGGTGGATSSEGGTATGGSGTGVTSAVKSAFGLATGGGGCSCSVPGDGRSPAAPGLLAGLLTGLSFALRRGRRRDGRRGGVR